MIAALSDVHVRRLFTAIGRPECADDPRFATTVARWAHTTEVQAIVEEWTSVRTSAECEAVLNRAGVASSRYFTVEEVLASEQVRHRGSTIGAVDGSGTFQIANTPFQLSAPAGMSSATGAAEPLRAADPGAHTREVLAAVLGAEQAAAALASGGAYAAPLA
jgi:formyl-CoA transferase